VIELSAIDISRDELRSRHKKIQEGMSVMEVANILGGHGYKIELQGKKKIVFWRFLIRDAQYKQAQYEIFRAEFEADKLVFGAFLPQG
jgi:hypothetical protein